MKVVKLECPSCKANLDHQEKLSFCPYCGSKILIDDESQKINLIYKKVDEAHIKEIEAKEIIRLKELENEDREKTREHREFKFIGTFWLFLMLAFLVAGMFLASAEKPNKDEVKMPASSEEYEGIHYKQVIKTMEDMGFNNIEIFTQDDLITGWVTKDGSVAGISINGDNDFCEGDIFSKDSIVTITYHTFPEKGN